MKHQSRFQLRLSAALAEALTRLAAAAGVTESALIRRWIAEKAGMGVDAADRGTTRPQA